MTVGELPAWMVDSLSAASIAPVLMIGETGWQAFMMPPALAKFLSLD